MDQAFNRWEPPQAFGEEVGEDDNALLPAALRRNPADSRAESMGDWIAGNLAAARAPFEPWDEIIGRVKAKEFDTQKQLAAAYHKPPQWVAAMKRVALAQKVMTECEWSLCFKRTSGNRGLKGDGLTTTTTTTATKNMNAAREEEEEEKE